MAWRAWNLCDGYNLDQRTLIDTKTCQLRNIEELHLDRGVDLVIQLLEFVVYIGCQKWIFALQTELLGQLHQRCTHLNLAGRATIYALNFYEIFHNNTFFSSQR